MSKKTYFCLAWVCVWCWLSIEEDTVCVFLLFIPLEDIRQLHWFLVVSMKQVSMYAIALSFHGYHIGLWLLLLGLAFAYLSCQSLGTVLALVVHVLVLSIASLHPCLGKAKSVTSLAACPCCEDHPALSTWLLSFLPRALRTSSAKRISPAKRIWRSSVWPERNCLLPGLSVG